MIDKLVQQAIQDLETNYVSAKGDRIVVRRKYKSSTEKWYAVYRTDNIPTNDTPYIEIHYFNPLAFLYHYYFTSYKHIYLKSEHPELLI